MEKMWKASVKLVMDLEILMVVALVAGIPSCSLRGKVRAQLLLLGWL